MAPVAQIGAGNVTSAESAMTDALTADKPANTADGDLLWASVYFRNAGASLSAPSGWRRVRSDDGNATFGLFVKPVPDAGSETATEYTFTTSGSGSSRCVLQIGRITGADLSDPVDSIGLNGNPYFTADVAGWAAFNSTIAHSTSVVHPDGTGSLEITPNGTSANVGAGSSQTGAGTVVAGDDYDAALWVNAPGGYSGGVTVLVNWHDSAGTFLSSSLGTSTVLSAGVWTRIRATVTAPASASQAAVWVWQTGTPAASDVLYAWAVTFTSALDHTGTSSLEHPSIAADTGNCLLLALSTCNRSATPASVFTADAGMSEVAQESVDNGSSSSSVQISQEALTASGATGTRTATMSPSAGNSAGFLATITGLADQTLPLGQASETDTANPITPVRTVPVGPATETDTAQLIVPGQIIPIGQATETDAATRFDVLLARANETDTAGQIKPFRLVPFGQASESDTATASGRLKTDTLGQASESDQARAVGPRVALAPETLLNGVPTPLGVRIYNNFTPALDVWVTRAVDDFSFRSSVPGGFASATITLHRPSIAGNPASGYLFNADKSQFDQLARLFNRVQIVDMRSAEIVWEGRIEGPRRSSDSDTWELSCMGAAVLASDIQRPMFYIDSSIGSWLPHPENYWQFSSDEASGVIEVRWEGDLIWPGPAETGFNLFGALTWQRGEECALDIGRYDMTFASSAPAGAGDQAPTHLWNSVLLFGLLLTQGEDGLFHATNYTENIRSWRRVGGAPDSFGATGGWQIEGVNRIDIQMGVGNSSFGDYLSAPDKVIGRIAQPRVQVLRLDRTGAELTDPDDYPDAFVTLPQVVEDVVGRFLVSGWNLGTDEGGIDPDDPFPGQVRPIEVYMDTSATTAFSHLTYFDGATAADILGDMMNAQPGAYWAIWESRWGATASSGDRDVQGHRFEWARWPNSWGYQATSLDGLEEQPDGENLYNYVYGKYSLASEWSNTAGEKFAMTAWSARHAIDDGDGDTRSQGNDLAFARLTRAITVTHQEPIDLGVASDITRGLLSRYHKTGNAGTITIRRPIHYYDPGETSYAGASRMVQPWEIRPGKLIRITDVMPPGRIDDHPIGQDLPPEAHDGTVWRVVATEYSSADNSCRLELDQPQAWELPTQINQAAQSGGQVTVALGKSVSVLNANPDMADGTTGWNPVNATIEASTEVLSPQGTQTLKVTPDGVNSFGGVDSDLTGVGSVTPGRDYVGSAWIYSPGGWATWRLNILWYDAAGGLLSTSFDPVETIPASEWDYLELRDPAPANASQARISVRYQNGPSSSDVAYLRSVRLVSQ